MKRIYSWTLLIILISVLSCNAPLQPISPTSTSTSPATPLNGNSEFVAELPRINLNVDLLYAEHLMQVRQTVSLSNASKDTWNEVVFNIPVAAVPDAFRLESVVATSANGSIAISASLPAGETALHVPLAEPLAWGQAVEIVMDYSINIPSVSMTDQPPTGTTGWGEELIQAGEWYPSLVPYQEGKGWQTWQYSSLGDPTIYPLADYRLTVKTEPQVTVVSGGTAEQSESGQWEFEVKAARGIAFLASPDYASLSGEVNGIPVYSYFLASNSIAGQAALDIAIQSVELYEELYGPYPYPSLTIAQNAFKGGMEYSALATIANTLYPSFEEDPEALPAVLHLLISHEVAHQWWYGAVGNDQVNEPWMDESLAFYSQFLYLERYFPEVSDYWWTAVTSDIEQPYGPVDMTIYDYDPSSSVFYDAYVRYGLFIHALRDQMGNEAFFTFLQDYYQTYSGKMATGEDFRNTAQRHTTTDLTPLYAEYFSRSISAGN